MKIGIFTSLQKGDHTVENAVKSCQELGVDHEVVDIFASDWIKRVRESNCDGFFCPSVCQSQEKKTIQDERYYFVSEVMHRPIYPNFLGLYIHESKRNMAAWLTLNDIPHADTFVFTNRKEALHYFDSCRYPVVVKANVGAGASKVKILKSKAAAHCMVNRCFPKYAASLNIGYLYGGKMFGLPIFDRRNPQKDYIFVQEFVPDIVCEWRILKVGDSYFGHQKLLKNGFASGSGLVGWVKPPFELLDMARHICELGNFPCMDVDIFETKEGRYIVNELQASFGSYLPYQMMVDGKHGRYRYTGGEYVFEEGDFNIYGSVKLKIEHFVQLLCKQTK